MKIEMKKSGFTLIELLVVIAIIGILATLMLIRFGGIRQQARDTKRIAHINQFQTALDVYANDHQDAYPGAAPAVWYHDCSGSTLLETQLGAPTALGDSFKRFPHDPLYPTNTAPQCYYYMKGPGTQTCGGVATPFKGYLMLFKSENRNYADSYPLYSTYTDVYCVMVK